jgi:hypothetical protein
MKKQKRVKENKSMQLKKGEINKVSIKTKKKYNSLNHSTFAHPHS